VEEEQRTTIWRSFGGEPEWVAKLPGLPDPIPKIGFRLYTPEYGDGVCIGYEYAGTGDREKVVEVKLLVRAAVPERPQDPARQRG
jgi:hypothetical protein